MANKTNMTDVQNLSKTSVHLEASICSPLKKGEYPRVTASSTGKVKLAMMPSGAIVYKRSVF
jgi:hypothetical protein